MVRTGLNPGVSLGNPRLSGKEIRNISIITARNSQKDALNKMGAERSAKDSKQVLHNFYSIDRPSSAPSSTNKFISGKLPICMGMPIMLRANDATELCITKGQGSVVCGWDESVGPLGQRVLDTLFVRLVKPPRTINIDGLPENVVALGKSRAKNPVELAKYNDHQSYYVALSRGFTAEGTIIIQGFSSEKVTSGMKGHLHKS
ncbi:hypothetical protein B0H13DRAFT_2233498 [Mycena leptocephala]|nr:hypothetical protein B0H13DRAFT_2233498 [Mycena leptocephala]